MSRSYDTHEFYCIKCGQKNISLQRKVNHKHAKHHMKKLWCWHCKEEMNCVECKNDEEVKEFKNNFLAGKYLKEVERSKRITKREQLIWAQ